MKEKLALAIGYLFGDGGISKDGRVHYCNSEKFLINEFIISMGIFNIKPYLREEEGIFRVRYPVSVGNKLKGLFGEFSSGKDTKKITKEIFNMPLNWKIKMLRSWFNDDGSVVNSSPNYKVIAIKQKLENLIVFIRDTLKEIGIESHLHNEGKIWCLRIFGYKNIKKFKAYNLFQQSIFLCPEIKNMFGIGIHIQGTKFMQIFFFIGISVRTVSICCRAGGIDKTHITSRSISGKMLCIFVIIQQKITCILLGSIRTCSHMNQCANARLKIAFKYFLKKNILIDII